VKADVVAVAEDPGALAYLEGVPEAIRSFGLSVCVLACGDSSPHFLGMRDCVAARDLAQAEALVWSARPAAVVVGTCENPDAIAHALTQSAKSRGIVSIGLVDGPANAAHRFRGRASMPLAYAPDWLVVPDGQTRARFIELGMPAERVRACGHPRLDALRAARERLDEVGRLALRRHLWPGSGNRKVVVFATELATGLDPSQFIRSKDYTLEGTSGSDFRTETVLEEFLRAADCLDPRPYLVLRLHPKTTQEMFLPYLDRFDACSAQEPAIDVLQAADVVVGLTSIILDEALVLGRPVMSIVPRRSETAWLRGAALGLIPVVCTREAIAPGIQMMLKGSRTAEPAVVDTLMPPGAAGNVAAFIDGAIRATCAT
jgi:hypothetical protein